MKINPLASQAVAHSNNKQPPAQAARALLESSSDAAEPQPFGKLVSSFARGLDGSR